MTFGLWEQKVLNRPSSTYEGLRRSPERRLLMEVLRRAVLEFQDALRSPHPGADEELRELTAWFFAPGGAWPFSFENACEELDLDPEWIRDRLTYLLRSHGRSHHRRPVR